MKFVYILCMIQAIAASLEKVQIFDYWKIEEELIAEGVLLTTEPSQLVNKIPLARMLEFLEWKWFLSLMHFYGDQRLK